jgi:hypothetical protein
VAADDKSVPVFWSTATAFVSNDTTYLLITTSQKDAILFNWDDESGRFIFIVTDMADGVQDVSSIVQGPIVLVSIVGSGNAHMYEWNGTALDVVQSWDSSVTSASLFTVDAQVLYAIADQSSLQLYAFSP